MKNKIKYFASTMMLFAIFVIMFFGFSIGNNSSKMNSSLLNESESKVTDYMHFTGFSPTGQTTGDLYFETNDTVLGAYDASQFNEWTTFYTYSSGDGVTINSYELINKKSPTTKGTMHVSDVEFGKSYTLQPRGEYSRTDSPTIVKRSGQYQEIIGGSEWGDQTDPTDPTGPDTLKYNGPIGYVDGDYTSVNMSVTVKAPTKASSSVTKVVIYDKTGTKLGESNVSGYSTTNVKVSGLTQNTSYISGDFKYTLYNGSSAVGPQKRTLSGTTFTTKGPIPIKPTATTNDVTDITDSTANIVVNVQTPGPLKQVEEIPATLKSVEVIDKNNSNTIVGTGTTTIGDQTIILHDLNSNVDQNLSLRVKSNADDLLVDINMFTTEPKGADLPIITATFDYAGVSTDALDVDLDVDLNPRAADGYLPATTKVITNIGDINSETTLVNGVNSFHIENLTPNYEYIGAELTFETDGAPISPIAIDTFTTLGLGMDTGTIENVMIPEESITETEIQVSFDSNLNPDSEYDIEDTLTPSIISKNGENIDGIEFIGSIDILTGENTLDIGGLTPNEKYDYLQISFNHMSGATPIIVDIPTFTTDAIGLNIGEIVGTDDSSKEAIIVSNEKNTSAKLTFSVNWDDNPEMMNDTIMISIDDGYELSTNEIVQGENNIEVYGLPKNTETIVTLTFTHHNDEFEDDVPTPQKIRVSIQTKSWLTLILSIIVSILTITTIILIIII